MCKRLQRQKRLAKAQLYFFSTFYIFVFFMLRNWNDILQFLLFWITFIVLLRVKKKRKWKFLHVTRVMLHNFSKNYVSLFLRSGKQWNLFLFSSSFAYCRCAAACRAHAILCECMFNWLYETFMNIIFFVLRKAKAVK